MADITLVKLTDDLLKQLNDQHEQQTQTEEVFEGTVVSENELPFSVQPPPAPPATGEAERDLAARVNSGEWDNLDNLPAFQARTPEGQLMARTDAIDHRVRQLELKMPMLLNQHLHDSYIQVLKKIHALRRTKAALFYLFYKHEGQRDLDSGC